MVVAFPVLNAFPDFPLGFGAVAALGFIVVPSGLTSGFGVVPSNFGVASYFHPSHLAVDPAGGGAAGGIAAGALGVVPSHLEVDPNFGAEGRAVNVPEVALAFTLGAADSVAVAAGGVAVAALGEALAALAALSLAAL